MDKILQHFKESDPIMYQLSVKSGLDEIKPSDDYFYNLCKSICSQQLSIKSAAAIFKRFRQLFKSNITPERVFEIDDEKLRGVGFSKTKVAYLKDLAEKLIKKEIIFEKLLAMENDAIITELTKIRGIGVWTAEMFLMFSLGRENIFSFGDLGLRNAIIKNYKLENPSKKQLEKLVEKWAPYQTYAARILWKSLSF